MFKTIRTNSLGMVLIAAILTWLVAATNVSAQHMHQCGRNSGHMQGMHGSGQHDSHTGQHDAHASEHDGQHNAHDSQLHAGHSPAHTDDSPFAQSAPHGGQMSVAGSFRFEVVYWPQEIRVYSFDATHRPINPKGIEGQVALTVRGYDRVYRYPLKHFTPQNGSKASGYLGLSVDLGRIKDGDMNATIDMKNLPSEQQHHATLTQVFSLSKIPVKLAALEASDQPLIEKQKVCAVAGSALGSMGTPVKVLVADHPIFLCCKGCLGKVQATPHAYLPKSIAAQSVWTCSMHPQIKVAQAGKCPICGMSLIAAKDESGTHTGHITSSAHETGMTGQLTVSTSTPQDKTAIGAQRVCAVAGSPLGGMGTPVKVARNGEELFLCCKGCLGKVERDPNHYFAKAADLRTAH